MQIMRQRERRIHWSEKGGRQMNRFLKQAIDDKEEMIGNRRFLHRNPEIGDDLPITAKFVSEKLTEYGIPNKCTGTT